MVNRSFFDECEETGRDLGRDVSVVCSGPSPSGHDVDAVFAADFLCLDEDAVARDHLNTVDRLRPRERDVSGRGDTNGILDVKTLLDGVHVLQSCKFLVVSVDVAAHEQIGTVGDSDVTRSIRIERDVAVGVNRADRVSAEINIVYLADLIS